MPSEAHELAVASLTPASFASAITRSASTSGKLSDTVYPSMLQLLALDGYEETVSILENAATCSGGTEACNSAAKIQIINIPSR